MRAEAGLAHGLLLQRGRTGARAGAGAGFGDGAAPTPALQLTMCD